MKANMTAAEIRAIQGKEREQIILTSINAIRRLPLKDRIFTFIKMSGDYLKRPCKDKDFFGENVSNDQLIKECLFICGVTPKDLDLLADLDATVERLMRQRHR
jgi:hypothetical protein